MFGGFLGAYVYANVCIWGGKNDRNLSYYCVLPQKNSNKWVTGCVVGTLRVHKQSQNSDIDIRLKKLVDERERLLEQIKKLKGQLEERQRNIRLDSLHPEDGALQNGTDVHVMDLQSKCQSSCRRNPFAMRDFYCTNAGGEKLSWQGMAGVPNVPPKALSTEAQRCFLVG
eukprot:bmy_18838T0